MLGERFQKLLRTAKENTGFRCVILVDEYDKPLMDVMENEELREHNKAVIKGFFSILKSLDGYIQCIFITGITSFYKVSIFSELQQLNDISLDEEYLECMEKSVPSYTEAMLETVEKTFGVIILETTHGGTPEDVYKYYKDRWQIEIYYDYLKHQMDFNALGVQDWAKLQGLAFMMLLATLINGSIQEKLKQSSLVWRISYLPLRPSADAHRAK